MKIFISWSGELSKLVALEIRNWLKKVIQAVDPYMSSKDTSPGTRLYSEIFKELEDTKFGISCITVENQGNTWINFEAGALAKNTDGRVCPLLIDDIDATALKAPLNQFKYIYFKRDDMFELAKNINESLDDKIEKKLPPETLNETFNVWWDELDKKIKKIKEEVAIKSKTKKPKPNTDEILEEVLLLCRGMNQSIQNLSPHRRGVLSDLMLDDFSTELFCKYLAGEQAVNISADDPRVSSVFRGARSRALREALDSYGKPEPTTNTSTAKTSSVVKEGKVSPEKE